jgi:hypothetical protein
MNKHTRVHSAAACTGAIPHHIISFPSENPYNEFEFINSCQGGLNSHLYHLDNVDPNPPAATNIYRLRCAKLGWATDGWARIQTFNITLAHTRACTHTNTQTHMRTHTHAHTQL